MDSKICSLACALKCTQVADFTLAGRPMDFAVLAPVVA